MGIIEKDSFAIDLNTGDFALDIGDYELIKWNWPATINFVRSQFSLMK